LGAIVVTAITRKQTCGGVLVVLLLSLVKGAVSTCNRPIANRKQGGCTP